MALRTFQGGDSDNYYESERKVEISQVECSREEQPVRSTSKLLPFLSDSLEKQLKRFSSLRYKQPEEAKLIYDTGEILVALASDGKYGKFRSTVESTEALEILLFHINKMFTQSLIGGYLMISNYIMQCGYPFRSLSLPPALHACLSLVDDDARSKEIIEFLVRKGFDINHQDSRNWCTPLHVAVKYQLVETVQYLLYKGADVNAVAKYDIMPLNIAEISAPSSKHYTIIIDLLKKEGARPTWRRECEDYDTDVNGSKASLIIATESSDLNIAKSDIGMYSSTYDLNDSQDAEIVEKSSKFSMSSTNQQIYYNNNVFSTTDFIELANK